MKLLVYKIFPIKLFFFLGSFTYRPFYLIQDTTSDNTRAVVVDSGAAGGGQQ
jgi:hypothetical protein